MFLNPEPYKHIILILSLLITASIFSMGCSRNNDKINPSGTLEATEVNISSMMSGKVTDLKVKQGDKVQVGDTLLIIDTELLTLKRNQTAANLKTLEAQRLAALDSYEQARMKLELAEITRNRSRALFDKGNINRQKLDEVLSNYEISARQVSFAKNQISVLDAEEDKLHASLAVFDRQLEDGIITSPLNGTVLEKFIENGELVNPGKLLIRIADLSEMELRFYLSAEDLNLVKIGMQVEIMVDAYSQKKFQGSIKWISSESEFTPKNAQTRDARIQLVYAVKIALVNSAGELHIGMPAEVILN